MISHEMIKSLAETVREQAYCAPPFLVERRVKLPRARAALNRRKSKRARQDSNLQPLVPKTGGDELQGVCSQEVATTAADGCTTGCTNFADVVHESLELIAADLRQRLSVDECHRLAELLVER